MNTRKLPKYLDKYIICGVVAVGSHVGFAADVDTQSLQLDLTDEEELLVIDADDPKSMDELDYVDNVEIVDDAGHIAWSNPIYLRDTARDVNLR